MKYTVELSRSQHMALIDLIAHFLRCSCDQRIEEFVDCSSARDTVTTPGELLRIVADAKQIPAPDEMPNTKARIV